ATSHNVLGPLHHQEEGRNGGEASCHLTSLYPFLVGEENDPIISGYESAFATFLAVQHLNTGDGSVIKELADLTSSCPIEFSVEFLNTHYNAALALQELVDRTIIGGSEGGDGNVTTSSAQEPPQPCAFLGAYRSSISGPTSTITSLQGYPQLSGMSTSTDLNAKYFGRTIPSDAGTATVVAQYFVEELNIAHLAVLATNDSFGNAYASQLRAALADADEDQMALNDALMKEAHHQGVAGNSGSDFVWMFSDGIAPSLTSKRFEEGEVLLEAYGGVGSIEASGGGIGRSDDNNHDDDDIDDLQQYNVFARQLLTLKQSFLQHGDEHPLASILPYYSDPQYYRTLSFLRDDSFLNPLSDGRVPFIYEATVLLGLAACRAATTEESDGSLRLSGERYYHEITATSFQGMSGYVRLDMDTGTRIANSTLFRLINFVPDGMVSNNGTVRLKPVNSNLFADGQWETLQPYVYNDGTTEQPLDIPPLEFEANHVNVATRAIALVFCGISIVTALYFVYWTWYKRNTRIIKASQPMFLYLTYGGCGYSGSGLAFTISLLVLNLGMLCAAAFQSWMSRNLSTEFQESLSIFRALTGILLVVFVGCPVLIIAQDNTDAFLFISSAIIFISCLLILLLIFIPKLQYEKMRQSLRGGMTRISGLEINPSTVISSSFMSAATSSFASIAEEDDATDAGERVFSTKAHNELVSEVATLKKCVKVLRANNRTLKAQARRNRNGESNESEDDEAYDKASILLAASGINIRDNSDDELSTENTSTHVVRFSVPDGNGNEKTHVNGMKNQKDTENVTGSANYANYSAGDTTDTEQEQCQDTSKSDASKTPTAYFDPTAPAAALHDESATLSEEKSSPHLGMNINDPAHLSTDTITTAEVE
ncbi:MAG: hypothetical protein SGILL_005318, partial [Bacillariaceae sp.]